MNTEYDLRFANAEMENLTSRFLEFEICKRIKEEDMMRGSLLICKKKEK